ncbi:MAG: 50S ribosomal protein L25 [Acidobacteriota bacterium]
MEAVLEAVRRDEFGKNNAGRLRVKGRIPAVLYGGPKGEAESVSVDPKSLLRILHSQSGANTLITLKIEGAADARVLVKEYQLHPVMQELLHADFYRVAMDKLLQVTVPVHLTGEAKGIKLQGAIVDFVHRELEVECLPGDIPEHINVDVSELMLHDGIRVRDLQSGGKWTALSEPEMLIVHLVAPKSEAEPVAADAAAATPTAEPEVMKKGKVEKEGEKE